MADQSNPSTPSHEPEKQEEGSSASDIDGIDDYMPMEEGYEPLSSLQGGDMDGFVPFELMDSEEGYYGFEPLNQDEEEEEEEGDQDDEEDAWVVGDQDVDVVVSSVLSRLDLEYAQVLALSREGGGRKEEEEEGEEEEPGEETMEGAVPEGVEDSSQNSSQASRNETAEELVTEADFETHFPNPPLSPMSEERVERIKEAMKKVNFDTNT